MKIGLTYDLKNVYLENGYAEDEVAEFDSEETIEGLEKALHELGHSTERIGHIKQLTEALVNGARWDLVFNICEGLHGIGREAQVPALLDAYGVPFTFSDPLVLSLTLHKGMTKRVIRDAGIPTAPFHLIENVDEIANCPLPFPVFIKPVAEGSGKGISAKSVVYDSETFVHESKALLMTYRQPVLVEKLLTGREFTVGILGTGKKARIAGVMEVTIRKEAEEQTYSRFIKENYHGRVDYQLVEGETRSVCERVSLDAWRVLGCRDAGRIDLKMDENGIPNFIEINPLAGINHIHSDLPIMMYMQGWSFKQLVGEIIQSASERIHSKDKK
ncbi:MAG: ATP-grasp domain-containing protein [Bacteroidales bacterium]|nr:ATP-grasp domain-containing protein [Bacteroidales bacterium]